MFGSSMNEGMILPNGITTHQEKLSIIPFNSPYLITNYCQPENYYCHTNTFLSKKVYWGWYSKEYVYINQTWEWEWVFQSYPFWFHSDLNIIPMSIDSIPFQWAKRKLNCLPVGKNYTRNLKGKTTSIAFPSLGFITICTHHANDKETQFSTIEAERNYYKILSFFW